MLKKNFIYNLTLTASQVLFPIFVFSYVSRIIGPIGIGESTFFESVYRYGIIVAALGIPIYGVREVSKVKDDFQQLKKLTQEIFFIHFFSAIIIGIVFLLIYKLSGIDKLKSPFFLASIFVVVSSPFGLEWFFQGIQRFKYITYRSLIVKILWLILTFLFVRKSSDSFLFFLLTVFTLTVNSFLNFVYCGKILEWKILNLRPKLMIHLKPMFLLFLTSISISIYALLDTIILGFLGNSEDVGIYAMISKIAKMPVLLFSSLGTVLIPELSKLYHKNEIEKFQNLIHQSLDWVYLISFPSIFLFFGTSRYVLNFLGGENFIVGSDFLIILSPVLLLIGLSNIFGLQIITTTSNDAKLTISVFLGMIFSLTLNVLLIPSYGILGTVIATLISEGLVTLLTYYFVQKIIPIKFRKKRFFELIMMSFILLICKISEFLFHDYFWILFWSAIFTVIYTLIVQYFIFKNYQIINLYNKLKVIYEKV